MCAFAYTYVCVCTWHTYATGKRVHTYVYGHMYVQACMHVWAHICAGTPACLSVHVYYMNTCACIYRHVCMHVCLACICYVYMATHRYRYVYTGARTLAQTHTCTPPCPPLAFGVSITAAC